MKNTVLSLLGVAVLTTVAFTASANEIALSPRGSENQTIHVQGAQTAPAAVASAVALSPRAVGSQTQTISGTSSTVNPYLQCRNAMAGSSPKAIGACTQNGAMSGCMSVAASK